MSSFIRKREHATIPSAMERERSENRRQVLSLPQAEKTTTWVPITPRPRQLEQARPEHKKPNNVSYIVCLSITPRGNKSAEPPKKCFISSTSTSGCPVQLPDNPTQPPTFLCSDISTQSQRVLRCFTTMPPNYCSRKLGFLPT